MKVQPHTEQELAENRIWKSGAYAFEVMNACEKQSEAGNDMIELTLRFSDGEKTKLVTDRLLDKTPERTRHACAACGLLEQYESGELNAVDFVGKTGGAMLKTEKGKGGYRDKNVIADYLAEGTAAPAAPNVLELLRKRVGAA